MEIQELHLFFEQWFSGKIPKSEFNRFTDVIPKNFELITPTGKELSYNQLSEMVRNGYNTTPGRRIWTKDVKIRSLQEELEPIIATYKELQDYDDKRTVRISTAVFTFNEDMPNSYQWEHVHETWVD